MGREWQPDYGRASEALRRGKPAETDRPYLTSQNHSFTLDIMSERSVNGCLAVAMGKVAWDKNQINRSVIAKLKGDYPEMGVFRAANTYLGHSRVIKSKKGEGYAIPTSPVPELVAANLAADLLYAWLDPRLSR